MKKALTLCLVHTDTDVLLGMKKRGFGEGRWNGFGGKVMPEETIEAAARRELLEEACIDAQTLKKRGILEFEFKGNSEILEVHVFEAISYTGEPKETEEMRPQWFPKHAVPFEMMWPDDKLWFPYFFSGKNFYGSFLFEGHNTIIHHTLTVLES